MDRINGERTVDIGSGRRGFRKKDAAAGIAGTELTPLWFNSMQEEILHCIEAAGLTPDLNNWAQLYQAIGAMIASALAANAVGAGQIAYFAMSTAPSGWFKANGAAASRTTYSALFAKIGTTYGVGDGSTTFNLPELRSEFIRGFDDGRGVDASRVFASWQKATLNGVDSDGASQLTLMCVGPNSGSSGLTPTGLDPINYSDYSTARGRAIDSTYNEAVNNGNYGAVRPRNIALLPCIKY